MKSKTEPKTYPAPTKEQFLRFGKALMAVPKTEIDKAEAQYQKEQAKKHAKAKQ